MSNTIDLKTLSLPEGTHLIKIKAKATGFEDSDFSNVVTWNNGTTPSLVKGDIIRFDALGNGGYKRFRVIKVDGANTLLMSLGDDFSSVFNASSRTTPFDNGSSYQNYNESDIDTALNTTYYNSLASDVKSAIVASNRVQSCYSRATGESASATFNMKRVSNNQIYAYNRTTQQTLGNRNVFALDLDDIKEYFGANTGDVIDGADLLEMYFEQRTTLSKYVWTASAYADNTGIAFNVYGSFGYSGSNYYDSSYVVRPTFLINLSTISYTKEE